MGWSDYLDNMQTSGSTNIFEQLSQANYEKYKDKFVDSTEQLVNSETFLSLMVAEMTNQDPLEPTSNTEFITQLASFSQLSYMKDSSAYAMANYASSLVGKIATATKPDGQNQITKTGVVESVSKNGNTFKVYIGGEAFDLSKVSKVEDNSSGAASGVTSNAFGDSIARAAAMVGMFATIKDGEHVINGFIESIKVVDGKITAVVSDFNDPESEPQSYELDKIIELTFASVVEKPEEDETETEPEAPVEKPEDETPVDDIPDLQDPADSNE